MHLERRLRQEEAALKKKRDQLAEAELKLAETQAKSALLRERLVEARRQFREELRQERQRLVLERREAMEEVQKKRDGLARRSRYIDNCQAKLVQLRGELSEMHRETLAVRLATEELWVQLSAATPPATLAASLVEMRNRLSEHYRESANELARQRTELELARTDLAEELERILKRKQEVDAWVQRQEEDLCQQAQRLRDRESEIGRRAAEIEEAGQLRELERIGLETEIQQLRQKLAETNWDSSSATAGEPAVAVA